MPIVTVFGTPKDAEERNLNLLIHEIQNAVASIEQLKISSQQVSVFIPGDRVSEGLGEEICVFICLYKSEWRDAAVQKRVAEKVGNIIKGRHFPESLVEVIMQPVDGGACWSSAE